MPSDRSSRNNFSPRAGVLKDCLCRHLKYVIAPRREVQVQAALSKVVAFSVVHGVAHEIAEAQRPLAEQIVWNPHVALGLVGRVVHDHNQRRLIRGTPGEADVTVPGSVSIPRFKAFQQSPFAVRGGVTQAAQESIIERVEFRIAGFGRPAAQVNRYPAGQPLPLALVNKPEAGTKKGQNCGSLMSFRRKNGGGARLVMVLKKPDRLSLIIHVRAEVIANGPRVTFAQTIVKTFVVGVIEALLLELPFQVPVGLGHKEEAGLPRTSSRDRFGPERFGALAPGSLEDVGENQHRHIAAHTLA